MNSSRSVEDNVSGGWYNTRRQYRSVAFGTWKVGGARDLSIKRGVSEGEGQLARLVKFNFKFFFYFLRFSFYACLLSIFFLLIIYY